MNRRVVRFVLGGLVLAIGAVVWLVDALDLDVDVLLGYLLGSALLVLGAAGAAVVVVAISRWFRR